MLLFYKSITHRMIISFLSGFMLLGCAAEAEIPAFVKSPLHSSNAAIVSEVISTLSEDVVLLEGGLEQGVRLGMLCRISRDMQTIGEIVIIESRSEDAAGLILKLNKDSTIQTGDIAQIKTILNS